MNFVNCSPAGPCTSKTQAVSCLLLVLLFSVCFVGCSDEVVPPSAEQLTRFEDAGPRRPSVDMDRLVNARIGGGPHRVAPGEVLELTMPTILQVVTAEEPEISGTTAPYVCRLSEAGTITLPVVGEIEAAGKTLAGIESAIVNAFHPEFTVSRPSVFAQVLEYKTANVSVTGAVNKPGLYSLRSDQASLVALLMEAEGIVDEGAAFIQITRADEAVGRALYEPDLKEGPEIAGQIKSPKSQESRSLVLPVKGLNIPFADVALRDGDRVIVERLREPMITVVGLVNKAGNFPYRPDVEYNLMHALGFAGGLNMSAEPRYATVYRLAADGTTVSAIFNIAGIAKSADPTDALRVLLKPYDVVAVEHTPRTRAKVFWDRVFRFYISTYIRPEDVFGDD